MAGRGERRIGIITLLMISLILLLGACGMQKKTESSASAETTIAEITAESVILTPTSAPKPTKKPTPKPTKEPTPRPTKAPTPTPTPTPPSVYIPREELPDGQVLEKGYYAVLPGEGAYYNVFDCYGSKVGSFTFTDSESREPTGIHTAESLTHYYRVNQAEVQSVLPESEYGPWIHSNENGFYEKDYGKGRVVLYDKSGKHVRTLTIRPGSTAPDHQMVYTDMVVQTCADETVVSFTLDNWETSKYSVTVYFVSSDGTINDVCSSKELPSKPWALLGRKYFLVRAGENSEKYDIYDFEGNLMMEDVSGMDYYAFTLWSDEAVTHISISDYYIKDGVTYDFSFHPVPKNTVDSEGNLIFGVEYDVEGITCKAENTKNYYASDPAELIAFGTKDGRTAIKTRETEYVLDCVGTFSAMNDSLLVLHDENYDGHVISLETGKELYVIRSENSIVFTDEYILVSSYDPISYIQGSCIIDNDGNVRYRSFNAYAQTTKGQYIILHRGPYVGIADLNGEWVMKSLLWELTRDQEYVDPWE